VDDPDFRLESHLRRTALPRPGGDRELADLMGEIMSSRLDRDRPLWDYWLVEGLGRAGTGDADRWALVSKVHHCMVDGISGTDLYRVLLDESPTPRAVVPDDWRPDPEPSSLQLATAALLELGHLPLEQARALAGAVRHPAELTAQAGATLRGLAALTGALRPATRSSLTGPPSARRHFAFTRAAVADVSVVRNALGGTFNDVVLAAITAAFRRLLLSRGEAPTEHTVRSLVPVSVRAPGSESVRDNEISLMLADLPVHLSDPVEQLAAVRRHLADLKAEHEADAGAAVVRLARQQPFPVVASPVRWVAHLPQRSVVTVTTDVPGPRRPLYALGRRLLEVVPYVPIASSLRTGVAVFSYCGQVTFGVTGDRDAAADVWTLAEGVDEGLARLVTAADGGRPTGRTTATAGRRPGQGSRVHRRVRTRGGKTTPRPPRPQRPDPWPPSLPSPQRPSHRAGAWCGRTLA
jgi:diacylglycerol O-acyltransferase